MTSSLKLLALPLLLATAVVLPRAHAKSKPSMQQILDASPARDWRPLDPDNLLVMRLPRGRVVIELAPQFAPRHVANVERLARAHYWDALAITRVQDNFVAQWGDPNADTPRAKPLPAGLPHGLPPEYERTAAGLDFTRLPDGDVYAPEVGFVDGFPVGEDPRSGEAWLLHCYGMVGVGRDNPPDSGNGAELYAVIGQAPRQLDRNIALIGRVVEGMDLLSSLPRGSGAMGFYTKASQRTPILRVQLASALPANQRPHLEVLRTDSPTFASLLANRRYRGNAWFVHPARHIGVCNAPLPERQMPHTLPSIAAGQGLH